MLDAAPPTASSPSARSRSLPSAARARLRAGLGALPNAPAGGACCQLPSSGSPGYDTGPHITPDTTPCDGDMNQQADRAVTAAPADRAAARKEAVAEDSTPAGSAK